MYKSSTNLLETNIIMIFIWQHKYTCNSPLLFNGTALKQAKSIEFLGVYIDENMFWSKHTDVFFNKIAKNIDVMNKLKKTQNTAQIYTSNII